MTVINILPTMLYLTLNAGLAWDIIRSIQNPFETNLDRFNKLAYIIPIFTAIFFIVSYIIMLKRTPEFSCGD
jgi:branched-subunit amino acid permease